MHFISSILAWLSHPMAIIAGLVLLVIVVIVLPSHRAGLGHIPGPFLAKYFNAYGFIQTWRVGPDWDYVYKLHRKYGDVVRIGPSFVSVNDPRAVETIYGTRNRLPKDYTIEVGIPRGRPANIVTMRDQDEHARHRRAVANAYSLTTLKNYEPYIDELISALFTVLDKHSESGEAIDIARWTYYFVFDVIGYLSFGSPIGFLKEGKDVYHLIKIQLLIISYLRHLLAMPWLRYLLASNPLLDIFSKIKPKARINFLTFSDKQVNHRLQNPLPDPDARPDILSHFIAQKDKHPDIMTDQNVRNSAVLNIGAGALSTSKVLEMILEYLVSNPAAQERLSQEMKCHGCTFPITWVQTQQLPYLEAVVREAIRLHVSLGSNLMREVPASGLDLPTGQWLPPKTSVGIRPFSLGTREDCFGKDSLTFNPNRWLQGPNEAAEEFMERRRLMDRADLTFGKGPRSCIGKNIALLETYKGVASLVERYQFYATESSEPRKKRQLFAGVKRRAH